MSARITIDPNVRVRGNQTFAGLDDIEGAIPEIGDTVEVTEVETGLTGPATVSEIDGEHQLIYLRLDWSSLRLPSDVTVRDVTPVRSFTFTSGSLHVAFSQGQGSEPQLETAGSRSSLVSVQ